MRILHVTPTYFSDRSTIGGGERYVTNLCLATLAAAPDGTFACSVLSFGRARARVRVQERLELHLIPGDLGDVASIAGDAVDALIAGHDVVHVHQCLLPFGLIVAARARLAGKLVLGTDHGGGEFGELEFYPRLGRLFDIFHAQSDFAAMAFAGLDRPVRVIRGPVDDRMFGLATAPRQRGLFVSLGRILPHKGYEHVIAALPRGARLIIAGRVHDRGYFRRLVEASAGRDVRFETQLGDAELQHLLAQASLLVHCGTHFGPDKAFYHKPELLALAPLEAMCLGTPALVSRAGALGELAVLRGCQSYGDARALAAMLEAAAAGDLFAVSPAEIRDDAVAQFGLRQFGEHYLALLREFGARECAA